MRLSRLAAAGAAACLVAGLAACSSSSGSSGSSGSSASTTAKSVTIWGSNVEFWAYQAAHLSEFTKETGIKVNYVQIPQATILDKEAIAQRANSSDFDMYEGPTSLISQDIGLLGGVGLKPFESNSKLNVTGFTTNGMGELGDCTLNGTLYCLPVFVDGSVIAYNKNLLTKAGISTPPATWAQVVTDADQITQKTGTPGFCTRGSEAGAAIATAHFMEAYYIPYNAKNKGFTVGPDWKSLRRLARRPGLGQGLPAPDDQGRAQGRRLLHPGELRAGLRPGQDGHVLRRADLDGRQRVHPQGGFAAGGRRGRLRRDQVPDQLALHAARARGACSSTPACPRTSRTRPGS